MRRTLAGGMVALLATPALACGHCVEDRIAAVYDHEVVTAAAGRDHRMAFFAIEGPGERIAQARPLIARAFASTKGVDVKSMRISTDAAALSLPFDGRRITTDALAAALNRALAARGLRVSLLEPARPKPG